MFLLAMRGAPAFVIGFAIWLAWVVSFCLVLIQASVALSIPSLLLALVASGMGVRWALRHRDEIVFASEFARGHAFPPKPLWGAAFRMQLGMAVLYVFLFVALFLLTFREHDPHGFAFIVSVSALGAAFAGGVHGVIHLLVLRFSSEPWGN